MAATPKLRMGGKRVSPEEISGRFRAGDRAKIKCFLRVTHDIWVEGKDSIEYEIV
ncbi:hypothetical protein [Pseudomonas capsici]|uniref:Uncharacterized protein n=1 Tax=Pseudomonas capsici TaxID=2810614 RepID=A0ABT3C3B6_9PSED|nr:hypothetical protein [Pseudomonas capsici]MBX8474772.1 hypothetical protein [Pseudomonas cichorii]MBN6717095.1 hypothetical protein [Pseudomonas capsici]MBN6722070.1 hypothetical protein [Pseudomonas capsici]MBN6727057.1 hypothetical protein [Pseudomonas capsici]MCV4265757.1 hypothetical protein [Pseudomonas capsici]